MGLWVTGSDELGLSHLLSFHSEMALFRNFVVNRRDCLCDVLQYASAQSLDFLELAKKTSFLIWKLIRAQQYFWMGTH
jgi:hypothetical protein